MKNETARELRRKINALELSRPEETPSFTNDFLKSYNALQKLGKDVMSEDVATDLFLQKIKADEFKPVVSAMKHARDPLSKCVLDLSRAHGKWDQERKEKRVFRQRFRRMKEDKKRRKKYDSETDDDSSSEHQRRVFCLKLHFYSHHNAVVGNRYYYYFDASEPSNSHLHQILQPQ